MTRRTARLPWMLGLTGILAACEDEATDPSPIVELARVDAVDVEVVSALPTRVEVTTRGNLPDSCTEIGEITQSRSGDTFEVRIRTTRPPDLFCAQVLVPFEEVVMLDTGNLAPGTYVVDVNGLRESFAIPAPA